MPMSLKAGAASAARIAAVLLVTAAPPLWAQQAPPPHILVVGPMVKIDGRLFIGGLLEGLQEGAKSGDSDSSKVRLDVKNVVSADSARLFANRMRHLREVRPVLKASPCALCYL